MKIVMQVFVAAGVFVAALVSLFSALENGIVFDAFSLVRVFACA